MNLIVNFFFVASCTNEVTFGFTWGPWNHPWYPHGIQSMGPFSTQYFQGRSMPPPESIEEPEPGPIGKQLCKVNTACMTDENCGDGGTCVSHLGHHIIR